MNTSFHQYFKDILTRQNDYIKNIVSPIKTLLDLNYFSYQKITTDNQYTLIADRLDYMEFYFEKQLYLDDLFVHDHKLTNNGFFLYPIIQDSKHHVSLDRITENCKYPFHINQQLVITRRFEKYYEIFCLATKHTQSNVIPNYMNDIKLITDYFDYFKLMTQPLSQKIDEMNLDISAIKGDRFFQENPLEIILDTDREAAFLKAMDQQVNAIFKLPKKQIECLFYLATGCRIKEIAKKVSLSPKTVEHYLASIKIKLGCNSREELFKIALQIPSIKSRLLNLKN